MALKFFNSEQRIAQKYITQLTAANAEQRLVLLTQMRDAQKSAKPLQLTQALQQCLNELLSTESTTEVKLALIAWADDLEVLATLLQDEATAKVAARRVVELNPEHSLVASNPRVIAERINDASPDQARGLVDLAQTPEQMATLAIRAHSKDLSHILSQPILRSEQGLNALEKYSRGHNKACHKHARESLDALKSARRNQEQAQQRLRELDETITKALAKHSEERPDLPTLVQHKTRLRLLSERRHAAIDDLNETHAILQQLDAASTTEVAAENPLAHVDLSMPDTKTDPYQPIIATLEEFFSDTQRQNDDADEAFTVLQQANKDWLRIDVEFAPSNQQQSAFDRLSDQLERFGKKLKDLHSLEIDLSPVAKALSDKDIVNAALSTIQQRQRWLKDTTKAIQKLAWPNAVPATTQLNAVKDVIARVETEVAQLLDQQSKARVELKDSVSGASKMLEQGQLKAATQHLARARKLQKLGYRHQDAEIAKLSAELGEMNDWQNFATEPKREELLSSLQNLADQPLAPTDQADRLKQLRQSWNELGRLRRAEQNLQNHFDELAEKAFAPCKAHFADQAAQRKENLQQRRKLSAQLGEFVAQPDWQQTPLQKLETISRQARTEWQSHHPCDHRALKSVERQFEALQQQLHEHIRSRKNDNLLQKQQLVSEAEALLQLESGNEATQQAKSLQQRWKQIGPAPRRDEHRVWQSFRGACDQIFQRRAEAYQADKAAQAAQLTALNTALDELEQQCSDLELGVLRERYRGIEEQAAQLKIDAQSRKRMSAAEQLISDRSNAERRKQKAQRLEQWHSWDIQVSQAEQSNAEIDSPHPIFADRCNGKARKDDLQRLTLEAEIAADMQSPEADQQVRMALQIELINKGLSNMQLVDNQNFIDRWCACGPKSSADDALRTRFFAALTKRLTG